MKVTKVSNQNKIDGYSQKNTEKKSEVLNEVQNNTVDPNTLISNKAVIKSHIQDVNHSGKFIGCKSNNSIWDSEIISRASVSETQQEKLKETKDNIKKLKNSYNEERMNRLANEVKNIDTRKESSITSLSLDSKNSDIKYKNSISMFDKNLNFERVPERSQAEKIAENKAKDREERINEDRNWKRNQNKPITSNGIFESFVNKISKKD